MVFPLGSLINGLAIAAGGLAGLLLGARLPERIRLIVFQGLGLCVMILGIQAALGTPNFWRLRIGIGHPRTLNLAQQVADFVLHPPRRDEQAEIEKVIDRCRAVVPALLRGDFALATRQLHAA